MPENNIQENVDNSNQDNPKPTPPSPQPNPTSTVELQATLELLKEAQEQNAKLMKELTEVKVTNAKLAITQSLGTPKASAEEILNKMFV